MLQEIRMENKWASLLKVRCKHRFYADGNCKDLEFVPTPDTAAELKNLRILFRSTADGLALLYDQEQTLRNLNSPLSGVEKLTFLIRNKNPLFLNFTELPFPEPGTILYFNNLSENLGGKDKKDKLLHGGDSAAEAAAQQVLAVPPHFELPHQSTGKTAPKVELKDALGKAVDIDGSFEDLSAKKGTVRFQVPHLPTGRYNLSIGKDTWALFISALPMHRYQGALDIYLKAAPGTYRLIGKDELQEQDYVLQFNNRSTFWRYYLIDQTDKYGEPSFSSPSVSNGEEIKFSKPTNVELNNGQQAVVIESQVALPLQELMSTKNRLNLKVKKDGKWLNKAIRLPLAGPEVIKPEKDTKKIYSEIYVYI
ncbi:MAG: hypothetical protein KDC44_19710 [Phaeodactylibacter sp.]|nr:hypothetical protein [Phaeodactylibacter sp.]